MWILHLFCRSSYRCFCMNEIHNGKYLLIVFCPLSSLDLIFLSFWFDSFYISKWLDLTNNWILIVAAQCLIIVCGLSCSYYTWYICIPSGNAIHKQQNVHKQCIVYMYLCEIFVKLSKIYSCLAWHTLTTNLIFHCFLL